jgi:CheY-like chemotaxis protein
MPPRIIIVDDEPAFAEIGELILSRAGYEVIRFDGPTQALKQLSEIKPDIILSDVEMPDMDGFEFLRTVRKDARFKGLPFILLSARRTYPPDRVKGLELGSDDYIAKPFSGDELIARVKAVLRRMGRDTAPEPEAATGLPRKDDALSAYLKQEGLGEPSMAPDAPPDPLPIFGEARRRLREGRPVAAILGDLSFFRGFNECCGFERGDAALSFTLQCLEAARKHVGGAGDVVSHLYADEFLVLTEPSRALALTQTALATFAGGVLGLYTPEEQARGFVERKNRQGRTVAYPFLSLTLAVASNQHRGITHAGQLIHIGRELLAYAKTLGGTRYVEDRRRDPPPGA